MPTAAVELVIDSATKSDSFAEAERGHDFGRRNTAADKAAHPMTMGLQNGMPNLGDHWVRKRTGVTTLPKTISATTQ
jgi:hypothetical protein